jgi:hypothetical protein
MILTQDDIDFIHNSHYYKNNFNLYSSENLITHLIELRVKRKKSYEKLIKMYVRTSDFDNFRSFTYNLKKIGILHKVIKLCNKEIITYKRILRWMSEYNNSELIKNLI